jgi:proteasome lid subunit RPN8/RPN11
MDGQIVPKSEAFELQGRDGATYRPMYPRDPLLPACESVNCHCIHRGIVNKDILGMSYEERKKLQQEIIDNDDGEWEKELDASNRAKAGIDISSEHESSKVKYDYASTVIDKKSIASATYRKKYSTLPETRKVQRKVASEARTMLRHRSGSKYEDLAFINSSTGETLTQTNCKTAGKVSPTRNMKKMIKNADENTIIGIHNHPTSSVPSIDDLEAAVQMKYKYGIVACHDGTVYKYNVVGELNSPKADGGLDKLQRAKYIEDEAERAAAVKKAVTILKDSGVEMEVL